MKKWLTMGVMTMVVLFSSSAWAQDYYVNAPNGVVVRDAPEGKRVAKVPYGYKVHVTAKGKAAEVMDDAWLTEGHWVKIKFDVFVDREETSNAFDHNHLYVFDGFLTPAKAFIAQKQALLNKHAPTQTGKLATDLPNFALQGDFFGDGVVDDVLKVKQKDGNTHLLILNHHATGTTVTTLGGARDPLDVTSYDFEISNKVSKGTPLWSNYEDDYRAFADVPKKEIVTLPYDALYFHLAEACGGGFVFWHQNKWNWLQQE